jgi:hypothetical protein
MQKNEAQTDFPQLLEEFRNKSEEHRDARFSILASTRGCLDLKTLLDEGGSGFSAGKAEIFGSIQPQTVVYGMQHACRFFAECTGRFKKPFQDFKSLAFQAGRILPAKYCDVVRTHLLIDPGNEIERWLSFLWWSAMKVDPANDGLSRCSQRTEGHWVQFDRPFRDSADAIDREEICYSRNWKAATTEDGKPGQIHKSTEEIPDRYKDKKTGEPFGPLIGSRPDLGYALHPEAKTRSQSQLRRYILAAADKRVWLRDAAGKKVEAYFQSNNDWNTSKKKLEERRSNRLSAHLRAWRKVKKVSRTEFVILCPCPAILIRAHVHCIEPKSRRRTLRIVKRYLAFG